MYFIGEGFFLALIMKCPACFNEDTKVIDSRVAADGLSIRRRRECLKCEFRFSTIEEVEILNLAVIKRSGSREPYSREKVEAGLRKALEKRNHSEEEFNMLVNNIERDIQVSVGSREEIKSEDIGEVILKHLKKFDKIAFIRFASVYQAFENVDEFQEELEKLLTKKKSKKR